MILTQEHVIKAISLATVKFSKQMAKDGSPTILHALSVLVMVSRIFSSKCKVYYLLCVVAVLHDIIEDSNVIREDLEEIFGSEVADLVDLLSREKGVNYEAYSQKILDSKSIATVVKYFDMQDNQERCRWITGDEANFLNQKYLNGIAHFKLEGIDELIRKVSEDLL